MTLRRKMGIQIVAMIVGLLLVSGVGLWGLDSIQQDYGVAVEGYKRLRSVYEAGSRLATAQQMLRLPHAQTLRVAHDEMRAAATAYNATPPPTPPWDRQSDADLREALRKLATRATTQSASGVPPAELADADRQAISEVLGRISTLASDIRKTIEASEAAAQARKRKTLYLVAILSGVVILAAVLLGIAQYRSVMRPLRRLGAGVRRIAAGHFADRIPERGNEEFIRLAEDFNRMAAELDEFYHELERKVAIKSKELIRSERLASVGYLAAGVAHEINNPLGIITGYAEYSLAELEKAAKEGDAKTKAKAHHADDCGLRIADCGLKTGDANPQSSISMPQSAVLNPQSETGNPQSPETGCPPSTAHGLPPIPQSAIRNPQFLGNPQFLTDSLQVIRDEAFRCKEITQKLLSLARGGDDVRRPVSLGEVARSVATTVGGLRQFSDRRLVVEVDERQPLQVMAVEAEMRQVVLNLTVNALEATPAGHGGEVRIEVRRTVGADVGEGGGNGGEGDVELSVTDNGRGMTPQTLERVFEPFFTEKKPAGGDRSPRQHGTGLGLSICHAIVQSHQGRIEAHSAGPGKGSRFTVTLPASV